MSRYKKMFEGLGSKNQGAFIPFVMLGDPGHAESLKVIGTLIEAGADALELGIPYSDPVADGPVIQRAAIRALKQGATLASCFEQIASIRAEHPQIPIGLLTYANLVFKNGSKLFYEHAKRAGVDSVLIADVPTLECEEFAEAAQKSGIAHVMIAPPNLDDKRLKIIADRGQAYTYVVTRSGITGSDEEVEFSTHKLIEKLKAANAPPPLFGFGISKPSHVKEAMAHGAAGVFCGSAIVKIVQNGASEKNLKQLSEFAIAMKAATELVTDSSL